jgi:hypothetical protein
VQTVLQIVYFYNPLLWLANAMIRRVREQAVDEMVMVAMGETAQQYPDTLINVARMSLSRPALGLRLIGIVESKDSLTGRIKHILNRPFPKSAKVGIVGFAVLAIMAAVLLPMARAKPLKNRVEVGEKTINEDHLFIATLPNGVTVELVGLCKELGVGARWWQPDGRLLHDKDWSAEEYKTHGLHTPDPKAQRFIVVRCAGPDEEPKLMTWEFDGQPGCLGAFDVSLTNEDSAEWRGLIEEFGPEQTTAEMRFAVAYGEFGKQWGGSGETEYGRFTMSNVFERKGKAAVTLADDFVGCQKRLRARDKKDRWHAGRIVEGFGHAGLVQETYVFETVSAKQIDYIVLDMRSYEWVTFKNVSLQGGHKTDVEIKIEDQAQTGNVPAGMVGTWQADILWNSKQFAVFPDSRIVIVSKDGEKQQTKYIDGYIEYEDQKAKLFLTDDGYLILYLISQDQEDLAGRFRKISDQPQTVWQDDISYDANSPESKQVYIPDADTKNTNVVLDLATGEMLPAGQEESQLVGIFDKMGKGDLAYDGVLICLRNGKVDLWDGKVVTPLLVEDQIQDAKAYKQLESIPSRLLVTTAEDKKFDVTVLSLKESGINIEYRTIISSTVGKEKSEAGSILTFGPVIEREVEVEGENRKIKRQSLKDWKVLNYKPNSGCPELLNLDDDRSVLISRIRPFRGLPETYIEFEVIVNASDIDLQIFGVTKDGQRLKAKNYLTMGSENWRKNDNNRIVDYSFMIEAKQEELKNIIVEYRIR